MPYASRGPNPLIGYGALLMGVGGERRERDLLEDARARAESERNEERIYRAQRDRIGDERWQAQQDAATAEAGRRAVAEGWTLDSYGPTAQKPEPLLSAPSPMAARGIGMQSAAPAAAPGLGAMLMRPQLSEPAHIGYEHKPASFDPLKSADFQRQAALMDAERTNTQAEQQSKIGALTRAGIPQADAEMVVRTGVDPAVRRRQLQGPPAPPVNFERVQLADGSFARWNPRSGEMDPISGGLRGPAKAGGKGGASDVEGAFAALKDYGDLTREFMGKGRLTRASATTGLGNQELVGRIESAQKAMLVNVKNLAELGVITGPDMDIVTDIIGDPLSARATARDPQYTLAKLSQAWEFLSDKARAKGVVPPPNPWQEEKSSPLDVGTDPMNDLLTRFNLEPPSGR